MVDALLVAGIEAEVRPDEGTEVWVLDNDELEAARQRLRSWRHGGVPDAAAAAAELRRRRDREGNEHGRRVHDAGKRWASASSSSGVGIVTTFLIAGSIIVAIMGWLADSTGERMWNLTIDDFQSMRAFGRVREGEVWRLVTPIFLHFGPFHLAFNMLWLHRLGSQIEHNHGPWVMLGLVLASAIPGNVGQYLLSGPAFGGMSGVVYGLFGFVWIYARFDRRSSYAMTGVETVLMMVWFLVCATGMAGPIANIGHAGGLIAGLVLGLAPYVRHVRARAPTSIEGGSWADVNLTGPRRFRWRFVDPYVPIWFLALAGVVIAIEPLTSGEPRYVRQEACREYARRVGECMATLDDPATRTAFGDRIGLVSAPLREAAGDDPESTERLCAAALPEVEAVTIAFGCTE